MPKDYRRHAPEATLLYQLVQAHLETLLADARAHSDDGCGLPWFVEREFRDYLRCGILAHGFARVHCDACGHDVLVGLSCKGRGICPPCTAPVDDGVLWVSSAKIREDWFDRGRLITLNKVATIMRAVELRDVEPREFGKERIRCRPIDREMFEAWSRQVGETMHAADRRLRAVASAEVA